MTAIYIQRHGWKPKKGMTRSQLSTMIKNKVAQLVVLEKEIRDLREWYTEMTSEKRGLRTARRKQIVNLR